MHRPPVSASEIPGPLALSPCGEGVYEVCDATGERVGRLKRIGAVWKFKAIGRGMGGELEPGGGPLTAQHNTVFAQPDAAAVSEGLLGRA
jgi:hypothetical protein